MITLTNQSHILPAKVNNFIIPDELINRESYFYESQRHHDESKSNGWRSR